MRSLWAIALLLLLATGCQRSPYAGYKVVGDDVHLKLLVIGDGEQVPSDSDSVVVRMRLGFVGEDVGSAFSTERAYLVKDLRSGALVPVLRRLHEGDSLSVIAPASALPWKALSRGVAIDIPDTGMIQGEISLRSLRTPAMIRAEAEAHKQHDPLGYELRLIAAYKGRSPIPFIQWGTSDLHYHITGTAADTNAVVVGDQITVAYQGRRLEDGKVFDEVTWKGSPLTFTYGDKDQVIQGLEVAIHLLREGQEGTFLLPSLYAFGTKGINGVLEPNMPVIYTVRLESVIREKGA